MPLERPKSIFFFFFQTNRKYNTFFLQIDDDQIDTNAEDRSVKKEVSKNIYKLIFLFKSYINNNN